MSLRCNNYDLCPPLGKEKTAGIKIWSTVFLTQNFRKLGKSVVCKQKSRKNADKHTNTFSTMQFIYWSSEKCNLLNIFQLALVFLGSVLHIYCMYLCTWHIHLQTKTTDSRSWHFHKTNRSAVNLPRYRMENVSAGMNTNHLYPLVKA